MRKKDHIQELESTIQEIYNEMTEIQDEIGFLNGKMEGLLVTKSILTRWIADLKESYKR